MRISDWSSDVCSSDLPPATAAWPSRAAAQPFAGVAGVTSGTGSLAPMEIPQIDVQELADERERAAAVIDVRQAAQYADAPVPSLTHIPLGDGADQHHAVPREGSVPAICARGGRSAPARAHNPPLTIHAGN